jgi:hypothetical protein
MSRPTFHLIPHTHWDREWHLSRAAFEARLVPAVDRILSLLERNPELRFHLDGQAILIEDYLAVRPQARSRVEKLARSRRLALGPWYVLADQLIPAGESLLRNLSLGRAFAGELGGHCSVLYSPDAFGHPAAGPLIAAQFGLGGAVVWRGTAGCAGKDLFLWRASSRGGEAILTLHLPAEGYEHGVELLGPDAELAEHWSAVKSRALARAAGPDLAILVGADHHAPSERLLDLANRIRRLDPDSVIRISSVDEFFGAVLRDPLTVGTVTGELRGSPGHPWSLQGVHGTRARLKRRHGAAELMLTRLAEPAVALAGSGRDLLQAAWRRLIQSQFHDTLAGCCADPVAAEQVVRLGAVLDTGRELIGRSLARLVGHDPDQAREAPAETAPTLILWNPIPRPRNPVVVAAVTTFRGDVLVGPPGGRRARLAGPAGPPRLGTRDQPLGAQVLSSRSGLERVDAAYHYPDLDRVDRYHLALWGPRLGGMAAVRIGTGGGGKPAPIDHPVRYQANTLANGLVSARLDGRGRLTLVDLGPGRDQAYHGLLALEDRRDRGDSYTPAVEERGREQVVAGDHVALAEGPLVGAVAASWTLRGPTGKLVGRTVVTLHAASPIVRILVEIDNQAMDHRLRLRVPTGIRGREPVAALAGAAFTALRRVPGTLETGDPSSEETPLPTAPAHRFVAAGRGSRGLAILAPGFFEYQWTEGGEFLVTLLRSVGELSRDDLPTRRGHAGWPTATPGAQELGRHRVELALVPVDETIGGDPAWLTRAWEDAFLPPIAWWLRDGLATGEGTPSIELVGEGLVAEAIKPAETGAGIVLRAVNLSDRPTKGGWRFGTVIRRADRVRADESPVGPVMLAPDCRSLTFEAEPGELVSIRVDPALEAVRDQRAGDYHEH